MGGHEGPVVEAVATVVSRTSGQHDGPRAAGRGQGYLEVAPPLSREGDDDLDVFQVSDLLVEVGATLATAAGHGEFDLAVDPKTSANRGKGQVAADVVVVAFASEKGSHK